MLRLFQFILAGQYIACWWQASGETCAGVVLGLLHTACDSCCYTQAHLAALHIHKLDCIDDA